MGRWVRYPKEFCLNEIHPEVLVHLNSAIPKPSLVI